MPANSPRRRHSTSDSSAERQAAPRSSALALDATDRQLLDELQRDGRLALAELGALVGLSGDAVRERLRRLEAGGAMQVVGVLDPAVLGYRSFAIVALRISGKLEPVLSRLEAVEEIDFIVCTAGTAEILVEVVCRDDSHLLDVIGDRIKSIPGVLASETFAYLRVAKWNQGGFRHPRGTPARTIQLDAVDRAIAAHLQRDGRAGYQALAHAIGQPYSTVRRRAQALIDSGAVQIVTTVDRITSGLRRIAGVSLRTEGPLKPILAEICALPEVEIALVTTGSFDVLLEVACADHQHLADLVGEKIRSIAGVRACETLTYLKIVKEPLTWTFPAAEPHGGR